MHEPEKLHMLSKECECECEEGWWRLRATGVRERPLLDRSISKGGCNVCRRSKHECEI